jgi:hypothetical protein
MTKRELLTFFEGYFGEKYSGIFLDTMMSYLDNYSEDFYKAAANVLVRRFSRSYNKSPGPAEFEKNMDEILAAIPKPEALPEPEFKQTDEEWAEGLEIMAEIKAVLRKKPGPMTEIFSKTMEGVVKCH